MGDSNRVAFQFLLPSLLFVLVFSLYPIIGSFHLSLHRQILMLPWLGKIFVGAENYRDLLQDPVALRSLATTLLFVAVTVPLEVMGGLLVALVLNEPFRGRGTLRAIALIPWALPTVVSSQMWRFIFNDRYGPLNFLLFGNQTELYAAPLADAQGALFAVMTAEVWKTTSFAALVILAGLQSIPDELYEAASIDGATPWQKFKHVTLPLLKQAILLALLFRTIDALRVFDLVFVMTQGGPADATNVLQFYGYKKTFAEGMIGYGSAISVLVFAVSLGVSVLYIRLFGARILRGT